MYVLMSRHAWHSGALTRMLYICGSIDAGITSLAGAAQRCACAVMRLGEADIAELVGLAPRLWHVTRLILNSTYLICGRASQSPCSAACMS